VLFMGKTSHGGYHIFSLYLFDKGSCYAFSKNQIFLCSLLSEF